MLQGAEINSSSSDSTLHRVLQANNISFEIKEYARYLGIMDNNVLQLPPIQLTQGSAENIVLQDNDDYDWRRINKGDAFKLKFNSNLPLVWTGNYTDRYFDIDINDESTLELIYVSDTVLTKHELPGFNFKFKQPELLSKIDDMDLFGSINIDVILQPKHGIWVYPDKIKLNEDGIDVGHMDLIFVSNMPVYPNSSNYIDVRSLVLRERGEIITTSDTIRITLSNGGEYDVSKEPQVANAKLLKITSDEIIITGFTKSDIIVNDIPIVISDREKIDINFNVDVFGTGYQQNTIKSEPIFHDGFLDTLYYARNLTNYVIPSYMLYLPGKLSTGDTLSLLLSGDIDETLQRLVERQITSSMEDVFHRLSVNPVDGGYEVLYEYISSKALNRRFNLPKISLPSGSKVDYVEYSIRDSEKGGVNATVGHVLQFNDLSFEIEEYARYEGIMDNDILQLPPMKLIQGSGDNIINKGDIFRVEFDSELPLIFEKGDYTDSYFDFDIKSKSAIQFTYIGDTVLTNLEMPRFNFKFKRPGFFQRIFEKTENMDEVFGTIELNVIRQPKHIDREDTSKVILHEDGIDVGIPMYGNNYMTGYIKGRDSNKLPPILIYDNGNSIVNSNDEYTFSLIADEAVKWSLDKIFITNQQQKEYVIDKEKSNYKNIVFKINNKINDGDTLAISNLYIEKLLQDSGPVQLSITNNYLKKTNLDNEEKAIEIIKYTKPYLELSWLPENQYQNDNQDDFIKVDLIYEDKIKNFHDDDYLVIQLPDSSGAKWIKPEYRPGVQVNDKYIIFKDLSIIEFDKDNVVKDVIKKINIKDIITGIFKRKVKSEMGYNKVELGQFPLEINDFIKEEKYNISIIMDNDDQINFSGEIFDLHSLSFYNVDIEDEDKIYSRVLFDMNSNYSVYGSSYETYTPVTYPKLNIKINNISKIDPNVPITFTLPKKTNLIFNDIDNKIIVNNADFRVEKFKGNKLKVFIENIIDFNKPIEIDNIKVINDNSSFSLFKDKTLPTEHQLEISYNEHIFISPSSIIVGTPKIIVEEKTIFWPFDEFITSAIDLSFSKHGPMFFANIDSVKLKIHSDNKNLFWSEKNIKNGYLASGDIITIPTTSPSSRSITIFPLLIGGLSTLDDITTNGLNIFFTISYDGKNFSQEKIKILNIQRLALAKFEEDCVINAHSRYLMLPNFVIRENKNFNTIPGENYLVFELNSKDVTLNSIQDEIVIESMYSDVDFGFDIIDATKNKLKISFNSNIKKNEKIIIKNIKIESNGSFEEKGISVYFERKDELKVSLDQLFKFRSGEIKFLIQNINNNVPIEEDNSSIWFSLRDSEEFNGKSTKSKFPEIIIENKGENNLFIKGNEIAIHFPVEIKKTVLSSTSSEIVKVRRKQSATTHDSLLVGYKFLDKNKTIKLHLKKDLKYDDQLVIKNLAIIYPDKILDHAEISFQLNNRYTPPNKENNYNINETITIVAGQPNVYLQENMEYLKNDIDRFLPPIILEEDKYLSNLHPGDKIKIIISDDYPATWSDYLSDFIETASSSDILDINRIKWIDDKTITIPVLRKSNPGEKIVISKLKIGQFNETYIGDIQDQIIQVELPNHYNQLHNNNSPYTFNYNFTEGNYIPNSELNIGSIYLKWADQIKTPINDEGKAIIPTLYLEFENINRVINVPDTFYLKIQTYDDVGEAVRKKSLYRYKWDKKNISESDEKRDIKILDIIKTKNEYLGIKEYWLHCVRRKRANIASGERNLQIESLRFIVDKKQSSEVNGYYNISYYHNYSSNPGINPTLANARSGNDADIDATYVYGQYTGSSICLGIDDINENERFYDEGQYIELKIYSEDTLKTETLFSEGRIRLKAQDESTTEGIPGIINNRSIIFDLEEGLSEGIDYQISGINFEIKGKEGKKVSIYTKKKLSLKLKINTASGEKEFYSDPPMIEYSQDFDPTENFLRDMNKNNDESFACYFEKKIEFSVDRGHPSHKLMFKINFTIKESERHLADFDPIAEELLTYYKQYNKNIKKFTFNSEVMLSIIDNEQNLPQNRRFHQERLKEKQSQFHYCLAVTHFLAGSLDRAGEHWAKWQYGSKKLNREDKKKYSINLADKIKNKLRDRWEAIAKNINNKKWYNAEVLMYEFDNPKREYKEYYSSIGVDADEIVNDYYNYSMGISLGLSDFSGVYHEKNNEIDNYTDEIIFTDYKNWMKTKNSYNKHFRNIESKYFEKSERINYVMTHDDVGSFIRASDSLYINDKSNKRLKLKYFTDNKYTPPSSIYSSNMYYSKKSSKMSYLLFDQSSIEESLSNYYILGGSKYIFIPENKELIEETIYTNNLVGWGFISLALLKVLIL